MILKKLNCLFICIGFAVSAFGAVKMPSIFSDNMMFQRDMPAPVWGTAEPNADILVEFGGKKVSTKAEISGKWRVVLPKMKADKTPKEMTVFENSMPAKKIKNILVGEVWVASGQSNMEWNVSGTDTAEETKKVADYPQMRYFRQRGDFASGKPLDDCVNGRWVVTTPREVASYSAVGFYFAERLMKELDVPVGIIYAALGATPMHTWLPADKLDANEGLKIDVQNHKKRMQGYDYNALHKKWEGEVKKHIDARKDAIRKREKKLPRPSNFVQNEPIPEDPQGPRQLPSGSFNAKIAPILGFAVRGVIWYQGEGDAHSHRVGHFEETFELLINTWRERWGQKDMPFYFVQLTSHYRPHDWPGARQAQENVSRKLKNAEMAVTVDVGLEKEIHPPKKKPVGVRLANLALKNIYKKDVVYPYSPFFKSMELKGDSTAVITFKTGGRKLECKGEPRGFEILTPDGKWLPAKASFDGKKVELKSPGGERIMAARYLWKAWAGDDVCIFNQDGLPAAPFTTEKQN